MFHHGIANDLTCPLVIANHDAFVHDDTCSERVVNVVALLMILAKDSYTIAAFLIVCYNAVVSDKFQKPLSLEKM